MFFKLTKLSDLILYFSEIPKIFTFVRLKQALFYLWTEKSLPIWSSFLFTVFTLEMRGKEADRKQMEPNLSVLLKKVSALEHDRFMQILLFTVSWLFANT